MGDSHTKVEVVPMGKVPAERSRNITSKMMCIQALSLKSSLRIVRFGKNIGRYWNFKILYLGIYWKGKRPYFKFQQCPNQKTCNYDITNRAVW